MEQAAERASLLKRVETDTFIRAYIGAALWSSNDETDAQGGEPLDSNYDLWDIATDALQQIVADCERFQSENGEALDAVYASPETRIAHDGESTAISHAGHDFWLTRNHHGSGYWDGDYPDPQASKLTDAAHAFGECDLYVGDDSKLYIS